MSITSTGMGRENLWRSAPSAPRTSRTLIYCIPTCSEVTEMKGDGCAAPSPQTRSSRTLGHWRPTWSGSILNISNWILNRCMTDRIRMYNPWSGSNFRSEERLFKQSWYSNNWWKCWLTPRQTIWNFQKSGSRPSLNTKDITHQPGHLIEERKHSNDHIVNNEDGMKRKKPTAQRICVVWLVLLFWVVVFLIKHTSQTTQIFCTVSHSPTHWSYG